MKYKKKIYTKMKKQDFGESMCNETKLNVLEFIISELKLHDRLKLSPEERFEQLIEGHSISEDTKYPDRDRVFIHDNEGNLLFQNTPNEWCWVSYFNIWAIFENEYRYNDIEIEELIKGMVEKHFGWKDVLIGARLM